MKQVSDFDIIIWCFNNRNTWKQIEGNYGKSRQFSNKPLPHSSDTTEPQCASYFFLRDLSVFVQAQLKRENKVDIGKRWIIIPPVIKLYFRSRQKIFLHPSLSSPRLPRRPTRVSVAFRASLIIGPKSFGLRVISREPAETRQRGENHDTFDTQCTDDQGLIKRQEEEQTLKSNYWTHSKSCVHCCGLVNSLTWRYIYFFMLQLFDMFD